MQLISCHPKIFSVPTMATLKTMKNCELSGPLMMLIFQTLAIQ